MSEGVSEQPAGDSVDEVNDDLGSPSVSAPAPERESYRPARLVTLISAAVAVGGCEAVREVIEWMNRIHNDRPQAEHYCPIFGQIMLGLGAGLCFLFLLARCGSYPPLRLAGKVSIRLVVLSLLIFIVPFWGPILVEVFLYVPVGFFGSVVVRAIIDSWFRRVPARSLFIAAPIATIAGLTALFLSVFVGKYFALAWTQL